MKTQHPTTKVIIEYAMDSKKEKAYASNKAKELKDAGYQLVDVTETRTTGRMVYEKEV